MERIAFLLFDLIICVVEGYLYYSFCSHFLKNRFDDEWKNVGIIAIGMLLLFAFNHFQRSALNLFASCFICNILCILLFKDKMRKKLYTWFISWFIMACSEFAVAGILRLTWGADAIIVTEMPVRVVLATIMMKIITLFVYRLICNNAPASKDNQYPQIVSLFFCLPVSSFVVCVSLCYLGDRLDEPTSNNLFLVFGSVLLLASNVVVFIICDRLIEVMNKVKRYEIMETKRQLEEIHYKSVNEMNEQVKTILHSMNGVMQTLDVLMQNHETEQIKQVIFGLHEQLSEAGQKLYCGNPFIDAILSEKSRIANEKDITYHVFVEPGFTMMEMKPIDLISLLSNLIDNAIEAATKCHNGFVDIKMFRVNDGDVVIIKIKNNYTENPVESKGGFQTKKENPSMHGIGVRQVRQLVEQYKGAINISYENHIFEVTISFFEAEVQIFPVN